MTQMNLAQSINHALAVSMREDPRVVVLGTGQARAGGLFRVTEGLHGEFGDTRVIDTPSKDDDVVGTAIGMALYGLRPVAELPFAELMFPAFDQIVSEAAKIRWRSGGEQTCPLVLRAPVGAGVRGGPYHSQSPEALFIHTPGLKVVCPSNPYDAKGLLLSAVQDEDPVIFFEPKHAYRAIVSDVPTERYQVKLGEASRVRTGDAVTVVSWGATLHEALAAADEAAEQGVESDVIDLRTLWPLDVDTVTQSVSKTGRLVVVHEAPRTCGFGAELVSLVVERAFLRLEAPPLRVTGWDTPVPPGLEDEYLPRRPRILPAILETAAY